MDLGLYWNTKEANAMLNLMPLFFLICLAEPPTNNETATPSKETTTPSDEKATPELKSSHPEGIAWIGTWKNASAEALRTGKPILLLSAAPQCRGIPGIW